MPTEPPVGDRIAVLMPMTSPSMLNSGPPELPLLMDGVGLDVVVVGAGLDVAAARRDDAGRDRAAEAERVADRHHPVADAHLVANRRTCTALSGLSGFTRSTARSTLESLPTISAFSLVPSWKITVMSLASPMTWLLVTTMPEASMMKPEPSEFERRCAAGSPLLARAALAATVEELLEEILERRAGRQLRQGAGSRGLDGRRGRDVDDRVRHLLGEIGEGFRRGGRAPRAAERRHKGERQRRGRGQTRSPGCGRLAQERSRVRLIEWIALDCDNPRIGSP